jgi:hypothetical protein
VSSKRFILLFLLVVERFPWELELMVALNFCRCFNLCSDYYKILIITLSYIEKKNVIYIGEGPFQNIEASTCN